MRPTTNHSDFASFLLVSDLHPQLISDRIRQAREEAGLTQQELADLLGFHKRTIENYEHGRVPWRELSRLARTLDKSVEWFLRGDDVSHVRAEDVAARLDQVEAQLSRLEVLAQAVLSELQQAQAG
jgi:transcriptional regulator with XRE-family HTH domain